MFAKPTLATLSIDSKPQGSGGTAGSTTSSLTSTSHTLTLTTAPGMTPQTSTPGLGGGGFAFPARVYPDGFPSASPSAKMAANPLALLDTLRSQGSRHLFLQPPAFLPSASLQLVKDTLDGFAGSVSDQQLERLRTANKDKKKRKRTDGAADGDKVEVLKIRRVHVDGFETGQVWQQAKRIINSALEFSERAVRELEEQNKVAVPDGVGAEPGKVLEFGDDGFELGSEDGAEGNAGDFGSEANGAGGESEDDWEMDDPEEPNGLRDEGDGESGYEDHAEGPEEEFVEDPFGLNDGFFSIDDFNRQTQWLEEQDARGDPFTDQNSDDEEIDWFADPFAANPAKGKGRGGKGKSGKAPGRDAELDEDDDDLPAVDGMDEDEDEDDEESGPTFGNMDLYAPEGASDDELDEDAVPGEEPEFNANDIYYNDFFAPPRRKRVAGDGKPKKSSSLDRPAPDDADVERAMADVRRDLYQDVSEQEDPGDDALSEASAGDPKSRKSNHERRQAKIAEDIRKLEAELVARRAWTMSGEAMAAERPMNSLLEENLDFEHVGKPVPVITTEVTESIEALIKRRILAQEFDEVIRRRPDASTVPDGTRRGLVSLDDVQATKGLAEIYEEEYVKANNPDTHVSASDEKLRREEREVERMWRDVCGKLDALSSWHYRPKQAAAALNVVADVAAVSMEDAQPATAQGVSAAAESTLAPQEVYRAGGAADDGEGGNAKGEARLAKSGLPVAHAEMSREEKLRRRRRTKERLRKAGTGSAVAATEARKKREAAGKKESEGNTLAQLQKGGVAVINRKGELVGVDGKKARAPRGPTGSGFKL